MKKLTDELMKELNSTSQIDKYLNENGDYLLDTTLSDYLCSKIEEKGLTKAGIIKKSEINQIYGYQILSGKRVPSRNKLLSICIGAEFSISEINDALKISEFSPLSPKKKRDSIIIFCIKNKYPIWKINEELYDHDFQTL